MSLVLFGPVLVPLQEKRAARYLARSLSLSLATIRKCENRQTSSLSDDNGDDDKAADCIELMHAHVCIVRDVKRAIAKATAACCK